jgi:hypothetical protein
LLKQANQIALVNPGALQSGLPLGSPALPRPSRKRRKPQGEDVVIAGSVSDEEAKQQYPQGWKGPKPYMRIVPQPR